MATVRRDANGQVFLEDPEGRTFVRAVGKANCEKTFEAQTDRVAHFTQRMRERGDSPEHVMIVLINVDDTALSRSLADTLMPGHDWQVIRDTGATPFARGLATREGIQIALDSFEQEAGEKLAGMPGEIAVVVFDHGTAEVFRS